MHVVLLIAHLVGDGAGQPLAEVLGSTVSRAILHPSTPPQLPKVHLDCNYSCCFCCEYKESWYREPCHFCLVICGLYVQAGPVKPKQGPQIL